jgi:hypothetical protein
VERMAYFGEVFDEMSIEVGKPNDTSYFFEVFGNRPINNGFNLDWVHRDFAMTNN